MSELSIPTEMISPLRTIAEALTQRLGTPLNYAQTYIALASAQASGDLQAVGCHDFLEHIDNPRLIEAVASLLEQHPELLQELQNKAKLQGLD